MKRGLLFILILFFEIFHFSVVFSVDLPQRKKIVEAEDATFIGGAVQKTTAGASGVKLVSLTRPHDGINFNHLPAGGKLAIRYSSLGVGLLNEIVNDQLLRKVHVHSTEDLLIFFLHAIIDILKNAELKISLVSDDITVNIDHYSGIVFDRHCVLIFSTKVGCQGKS